MADSATANKMNFTAWLAETKPGAAASIKASINILNILLFKSRIIKCYIFQMTDTEQINSLIDRIRKNKGIKIHSKRQRNNYLTALNTYRDYLEYLKTESGCLNNDSLSEEDVHVADEKPSVKSADVVKIYEESTEKIGNEKLKVSFVDSCSYAYTRPSDLEYFGEHYAVKNWAQLYVQIVRCLLDDYPDTVNSLLNLNIGGRGRIDISDATGAKDMTAPKEITDKLYLETNISASDITKKIKQLLDLCEVDYEDVVIFCSPVKSTSAAQNAVSELHEKADIYSSTENVSFFDWMTETEGMETATGRSYASAINTADEYVKEHHIGNGELFGTRDYMVVRETADALAQTSEFIEFSRRQRNRFRFAFKKYLQYLNEIKSTPKVTADVFENVNFKPYIEILAEKYKKGFRISSNLEMKRFRLFWLEKYGTELTVDDDTIRKYIGHITIRHQNFVYLPEIMLNENTKERLKAYISACFEEGKKAVYFDAIYKEFRVDFEGQRINNPDMLKSYLAYINNGRYYIHRSYLTIEEDAAVNPTDEVRDCLINAGVPVTVQNLKEELSHIDEDKISWAVSGSGSDEFVRNQKGEYFHADIITFTQLEMYTITELIQQAIDDKDYIGGKELTDAIAIKLPAIQERYPFLTWLGLRDVIAYKLRDVFSFRGKIISAHGQDLSMSDVFSHYARSHEYFTLEQLNSLKRDLDTPIYFDSVYANSLRINRDEFVSRDKAQFDVNATDVAIDRFCTGDYIAIKEIAQFGSFPYAVFPWNRFLLENYVSDYSKKYKLMHIGFTAGTPVGAIVKRSSHYENFDELITTVLADSNISLNIKNALQYLYDTGITARRNYKGIEQILVKARLQRSQKG